MTNTIYGHWPDNSPVNVSRWKPTNNLLTAWGKIKKMPTYLNQQLLEQLDSWEV